MKRVLLSLAVMLIIISALATVFASNRYDIDELHLSVEAPEGWVVMTRNPETNKEAEQLLGFTTDGLMDYLEKSFMYIDVVNKDVTAEIFINMAENSDTKKLISINGLSDERLEDFAEDLMGISVEELKEHLDDISFEGVRADDITWKGYDIYHHDQVVFLKLYYTKNIQGIEFPSVQYSTIQNGQTINISASSYTGEMTESLEAVTKQMVDSIVFTQLQERKAGIDYYNLVKTITLIICIAGILFFGIFMTVQSKKKKDKTKVSSYAYTNSDDSDTETVE